MNLLGYQTLPQGGNVRSIMKIIKQVLLTTLLSVFTITGHAQIEVKSVQPPAWKQDTKQRTALFPGDILDARTTIITGNNARVQLELAEGSIIELGENTRTKAPKAETKQSIFDASIDMLQGAFRFTTASFAKRRQRSILINLPSSTIGIRGTDLWGRSSTDSDFVVLIEGDIEIEHDSGEKVRLQSPATVYEALQGSTPKPVRNVGTPELLGLAAETALIPDRTALKIASDYTLIIGSFVEPQHAEQVMAKLHIKGYPANLEPVKVNGIDYTRVVFEGFDDLDLARSFSDELYDARYISSSWISKNN